MPPRGYDLCWSMISDLDEQRYAGLTTDAEGRVTFPTLIPGAPYVLSVDGWGPEPQEKSFTVEPGQNLDLGEFRVK